MSAGADYLNTYGRPDIWVEHGETVSLYDTDVAVGLQPSDLSVIWRRIMPDNRQYGMEGEEAETFSGTSTAAVRKTDMASPPGPKSYVVREGQRWEIRDVERKDEYTYVLHLAIPDGQNRIKRGIRR